MSITPPIDVTVEIAPGADLSPGALGLSGTAEYVDISDYRRQSAPIEIEYGRDDEASAVDAGSGSMTLDLRDGNLSPHNPEGEYYGRLAPNVPVRIKLPLVWQDTFVRPATSGIGWGDADSGHTWESLNASRFATTGTTGTITSNAANQITYAVLADAGSPDMEIRFGFSIDAIPQTAQLNIGCMLRHVDIDNYMAIYTQLRTDGTIRMQLVHRIDGESDNDLVVDTTESFTAGDLVNLRVQAEGGVYRARGWVGDRVADEPPLFWDIEQGAVEVEGSGVGLFAWRLTGENAPGNRVFTFHYYEVDALLHVGNIPDLPPAWDKSGRDTKATVELGLPLRPAPQAEPAKCAGTISTSSGRDRSFRWRLP